MDFDKIGGDEMLGKVIIPPKVLYEARGERMEFKLGPPPGHSEDVPGHLAVRCRRATDYDLKFMKEYNEAEKAAAAESEGLSLKDMAKHATESAGGGGNLKAIMTRVKRVVRDKDNPGGIKQVCR